MAERLVIPLVRENARWRAKKEANMEFKLTQKNREILSPASTVEQMIIIGGGPAGYTAALYGARAALSPLVLLGPEPGGQAATSDLMENVPGFPEGIGGQALAARMREQAENFGARLEPEEVVEVDLSQRPFRVKTFDRSYLAKTVIVATGAHSRRLGVPGEDKFVGRGVSFCANCDGLFYKDKTIVVVGGGDSACDESQFLSKFAQQVYLVHRRDQLRANKRCVERILSNPKIAIVWNTVVDEILGERRVRAVKLRRVDSGEVTDLPTDGVFIYVGLDPNTRLFAGQLTLDDQGYIVADRRQNTSVPGVFAAGDAQDPDFRQVATAAGTGAAAAIEAEHFLARAEEDALARVEPQWLTLSNE
jgi:thioredoxin reductase (NADPH)